jgi:hypothetical protein
VIIGIIIQIQPVIVLYFSILLAILIVIYGHEITKETQMIPVDRDILEGIPLHYPEAREWMWDYCMYLGPYTVKRTDGPDEEIDLGVCFDDYNGISLAAVYDNKPGSYMSGSLAIFDGAMYDEAIVRLVALKIIKPGGDKKTLNIFK